MFPDFFSVNYHVTSLDDRQTTQKNTNKDYSSRQGARISSAADEYCKSYCKLEGNRRIRCVVGYYRGDKNLCQSFTKHENQVRSGIVAKGKLYEMPLDRDIPGTSVVGGIADIFCKACCNISESERQTCILRHCIDVGDPCSSEPSPVSSLTNHVVSEIISKNNQKPISMDPSTSSVVGIIADVLCKACCNMLPGNGKERCIIKNCVDVLNPCSSSISNTNKILPSVVDDSGVESSSGSSEVVTIEQKGSISSALCKLCCSLKIVESRNTCIVNFCQNSKQPCIPTESQPIPSNINYPQPIQTNTPNPQVIKSNITDPLSATTNITFKGRISILAALADGICSACCSPSTTDREKCILRHCINNKNPCPEPIVQPSISQDDFSAIHTNEATIRETTVPATHTSASIQETTLRIPSTTSSTVENSATYEPVSTAGRRFEGQNRLRLMISAFICPQCCRLTGSNRDMCQQRYNCMNGSNQYLCT